MVAMSASPLADRIGAVPAGQALSKRRFVVKGVGANFQRERRAMRRSAVILAALVLTGTAAGDEVKPGGRYAVQPSADGFIRLDTETGAVSHCGRREGVWFCEKLVEDQTALERRIAELATRLDA